MKPYYEDGVVTLWHGDALAVLRELPDQSVDCCVTSPPYFGLRSYLPAGHPDKASELGAEASPAEFVENLRRVFAEVRRVLADDGVLFVNLGDSYSKFLPAKNLLGIPWRVAFALQDDGWILRNDIIWAKPNGMPESVTDRLSTKHEHVFMLSKSQRYWFDLDAIREPVSTTSASALNWARDTKEADVPGQSMRQHRADRTPYAGMPPQSIKAATGAQHVSDYGKGGRNPGDVWTIATQPFGEAHFAVMPQALASRAIQAGCKPDGVVLDPFSGSGTTGLAAAKHGRRYVGIDLNAEYLDLSLRTRLAQAGLDFGEAS